MWIISKLSINTQDFIAKILAKVLYKMLAKRRKIAQTNIKLCFKNYTNKQQENLLKQHFYSLAIGFIATANCFYMSNKRLDKIYTITNLAYLQQALAKNKAIIILTGHFTPLMISSRIILRKQKIANIYRQQNNPIFDNAMYKNFKKHGAKMISANNSKKIITTLKAKIPIWYAPDQDLGRKNTIFTPFFNIQTATLTSTAKLAKITNAVVIPMSCFYDNKCYKLVFQKPIKNYPSGDLLTDTTLTNSILEKQILQHPEQYLWVHKRFKTRPSDDITTNYYKYIS